MTLVPTRRGLSPSRGRLLDLMREIGFGSIEGLIILGREPVFRPAPRIVREVKFAGEAAGPSATDGDFALKAQVIALFDQFDQIRDGRIDRLEIKHGLPFRMNIEAETGGTAA